MAKCKGGKCPPMRPIGRFGVSDRSYENRYVKSLTFTSDGVKVEYTNNKREAAITTRYDHAIALSRCVPNGVFVAFQTPKEKEPYGQEEKKEADESSPPATDG